MEGRERREVVSPPRSQPHVTENKIFHYETPPSRTLARTHTTSPRIASRRGQFYVETVGARGTPGLDERRVLGRHRAAGGFLSFLKEQHGTRVTTENGGGHNSFTR